MMPGSLSLDETETERIRGDRVTDFMMEAKHTTARNPVKGRELIVSFLGRLPEGPPASAGGTDKRPADAGGCGRSR